MKGALRSRRLLLGNLSVGGERRVFCSVPFCSQLFVVLRAVSFLRGQFLCVLFCFVLFCFVCSELLLVASGRVSARFVFVDYKYLYYNHWCYRSPPGEQ